MPMDSIKRISRSFIVEILSIKTCTRQNFVVTLRCKYEYNKNKGTKDGDKKKDRVHALGTT